MATGFQKDSEGFWIAKDPNASKNYTIDWSKWLTNGDTLQSVVFNVPTGLIKIGEGLTPDALKGWVRLGGGALGSNYIVTAHIVTVQGNEDDQSFRVVIREN